MKQLNNFSLTPIKKINNYAQFVFLKIFKVKIY